MYTPPISLLQANDTVSGLTDPDTELRVSFLTWDGLSAYTYTETHTTSDLNGNFIAVFPGGGIRPDTRVDVAVMDPSGSGSYMMTGQPYVEIIKNYGSGLNCVWGRVDKPNADVILELERDGIIYPRDPDRPIVSDPGNMVAGNGLCYAVWYDGEIMEFVPGDILRLHTDTWSGEVTFLEIHVSGWAPDNEVDVGIVNGPLGGEVALQAYASDYDFFSQGTVSEARCSIDIDVCTMIFDSFDVRAGVFMLVNYYDPVTGYAIKLEDQYHYFRTIGNSAVQGYATPTEAITLTLYEPFNPEPVYISTNDLDQDPTSFYFDFGDCDQFPNCPNPPLQPGYTVEVQYQWHYTGDWQLTYQEVTVDGDPALDLISSSSPDGMVELSAGFEEESFDQMAPTWNSQAVISTTFFGYDLGWGDSVNLTYKDPVGNYLWTSKLMGEIRRVEFWIQPDNQVWLWGTAQPSSEVVIQTSRGDTLYGYTEAINGNFGTDHSTLLLPGDSITVTAGEGIYPVTIDIPDVWSSSDSATNTVSGHTGFPEQTMVEINAWWSGEMFTATTGLDGEFTKILPDIPPQGRGHIRFIKEFGETNVDAIFHRPFFDLEPFINTNYAHDWVESQYDVGYTVAITVTDESGNLKATAHGETSIIPWWGEAEPGFSTGYNVFWDGLTPDLQPFDHIYLDIGGRSADLRVGEITGELNLATDTLVGTLNASWLTFPVEGDCGVWIENGQGVGFTTDELGNFTCDFAGVEDLLPGMDIGVGYNDQEKGRVYNVFNVPAPHLWINVEHQGEPAQGNNYAFLVHYNNDGWATANNVVITQTFEGMTYLSDTSGFPHMGTGAMGDPVTWQVGDLPVNHYTDSSFFVFVSIDDPTAVSTAVNISTIPVDYYQDEGSKHSESGLLMVVENDSDLSINKWAWTWAPAPGQEFVYAVNTCNNGMASSSEVLMTDTLPLATTLVDWWGQYPGWEEVSSAAHELVVKRPSISGNGGCSEVYINVLLDAQAQPDEELINLARVGASSDVNPTNNEASMKHPVGSPDYNLHLSTNWVQGKFVPGGEVSFEFNYSNWGSMPIPGTVITTTLPQGTEFIMAYTWDWSGWHLITDTIVGDGYVRWELGDFKNGYSSGLGVQLKIADDTPTGSSLVVENRIMGEATEYRYDDNILVYTELVNPNGPNLRVDKHTNWWWNDWGDGIVRHPDRWIMSCVS